MNAEDLITELQKLIDQYGNLYVENEEGVGISIEFNDDEGPAFVIS